MDSSRLMKISEAAAQVVQPPCAVLQGTVNYEWTFARGHVPYEEYSEEEPPIRFTGRAEGIAIDGVLGLYNSRTQEITVYRKGIRDGAESLGVCVDDLTFVVRLHEWSHALLHVGLEETVRSAVVRNDDQWAEWVAGRNTWFDGLPYHLHETLAQLLTLHGLRWLEHEATLPEAKARINRIMQVFGRLMQRAPSAYQVDKYSDIPKRRILESIRLLKSGGLVGTHAWETSVTW
jgi:hypothetical protein